MALETWSLEISAVEAINQVGQQVLVLNSAIHPAKLDPTSTKSSVSFGVLSNLHDLYSDRCPYTWLGIYAYIPTAIGY
jgi:hypothetical protein